MRKVGTVKKGEPETPEQIIVAYLKMVAKDNPRPPIKDETWQRIFAAELAGKLKRGG